MPEKLLYRQIVTDRKTGQRTTAYVIEHYRIGFLGWFQDLFSEGAAENYEFRVKAENGRIINVGKYDTLKEARNRFDTYVIDVEVNPPKV
ncbi:MAG: hypothetical protein HYT70_01125 [Candidatus Aenigmarchaeota archaeon]|nr:hypothetical protein [Candidatus Aenigmarchaeota archaeon]